MPERPIADLTVHRPDDDGMRKVSFVLMGKVAVTGIDPIKDGDDALGTLLDQLGERFPEYRIRVTFLRPPGYPGEADHPRRPFPSK